MKNTKELFEEFKNKRFVFYGSYAQAYYSGAEAYTGLVFESEEFYKILEKTPELLPGTEEDFYELDGKHSCTEGEKFIKEFDSLVDYYLWSREISDLDFDSAYDYVFNNYMEYQEELAKERDNELTIGELSYKFNQFIRTANALHSLDDWKRESVFDYIDKSYEVKTIVTLIKKEEE